MKPAAALRLAAPATVIALLAACAATGVGEDAPTDAASRSPDATRPPFESAPPLESAADGEAPAGVADAVWNAILADLDEGIGGDLEASAVELVSVEQATWSDGSLGCPKPGELYTQALVDGVRVVVELDGTEYDYRVPNNGQPVLCE